MLSHAIKSNFIHALKFNSNAMTDNATEQISNQARAQSEMHVELMDDIGHIASETKRVIETLDEGSNQVKVLREQTDEHFEDVVKNLKVINGSVVYLAELIRDVQNFFHEKMDVVSFYINTSGRHFYLRAIDRSHLLITYDKQSIEDIDGNRPPAFMIFIV